MKTAVSIIVPVFNVENYLEDCIESLLEQDIDNYEIILVDDGSNDSSGIICDKYAQQYSNIFAYHKCNGGLGSSRNYGIKFARGKYILFIDSDDYLKKNCLGNMIKIADNDQLDLLLYGCIPFTNDGHFQNNDYPRSKLNFTEVFSGTDGLSQALSVNEYVTSVCMRLMRTEFIINTRLLFNEKFIHEDEDFAFLSYLQAKRVKNVPDDYYYRRYRNGSILATRSFVKVYNGYSYALKSIETYINSHRENRREIELCKKYQNILIKALINLWTDLNAAEREKYRKKIEVLLHQYHNNECYLNPGIKLLYHKLNLYRQVRIIYTYSRLSKDSCKKTLRLMKYEPESLIKIPQHLSVKRKIYLLGTPRHGNVGDHLIAEAEKEFIGKFLPSFTCIDCTMMFSVEKMSWIKKHSSEQDVIAVSGGGWLGTEWRHNEEFVRNIIYSFPENKIVIFPQTVFYKDDNGYIHSGSAIYSSHKNLYFACREKKSFDFIHKYNFLMDSTHSLLMPDMALYTSIWKKVSKDDSPKHIGVCLRADREISLSDEQRHSVISIVKSHDNNYVIFDTNENIRVSSNRREEYILRKMRELNNVSILVTDRLHAMILAALTGTPCIAFDNSTHKVMGVYQWIKKLEYIKVINDSSDLEQYIDVFSNNYTKWTFADWNQRKYLKELAKWFE